jgi:hypothetical protein
LPSVGYAPQSCGQQTNHQLKPNADIIKGTY